MPLPAILAPVMPLLMPALGRAIAWAIDRALAGDPQSPEQIAAETERQIRLEAETAEQDAVIDADPAVADLVAAKRAAAAPEPDAGDLPAREP